MKVAVCDVFLWKMNTEEDCYSLLFTDFLDKFGKITYSGDAPKIAIGGTINFNKFLLFQRVFLSR